LVTRPLLHVWCPDLSRVVQPLAGEWAIRRETFASLLVPVGHGVEMSTLLDVYATRGLDAIAQVDLGARGHAHQSVHDLGLMAAEVITVAARRAGGRCAEASDSAVAIRANCHSALAGAGGANRRATARTRNA
jgi:glucosyl-3-phosphoglycerate synthase